MGSRPRTRLGARGKHNENLCDGGCDIESCTHCGFHQNKTGPDTHHGVVSAMRTA